MSNTIYLSMSVELGQSHEKLEPQPQEATLSIREKITMHTQLPATLPFTFLHTSVCLLK